MKVDNGIYVLVDLFNRSEIMAFCFESLSHCTQVRTNPPTTAAANLTGLNRNDNKEQRDLVKVVLK